MARHRDRQDDRARALGALVGLAFLTKTLDAFIVVPALGVAYLWCGPPRLARRLGQLGWAALALLVSSGWWVAIVELWPKSARPYIGGSTDNSELNLIFGYNGFSRIFGSGGGAGAAGGATTGGSSAFGGGEGLLRMFDSELGGQISWLLPVALVGLVAGLWLTRRHRRTDRQRAGFVLWGGTLLMYLAVYDYAKGIFHPYYTVVMAPAVAALAGAGAVALWRLGRQSLRWAWVLPAAIVGTVLWADTLLARTSGYDSWVGPTVVVTGVVSALVLFLCLVRPQGAALVRRRRRHRGRRLGAGRTRGVLADDARHDHERHRHGRAHLERGRPRCGGGGPGGLGGGTGTGGAPDGHAHRRAAGWRDGYGRRATGGCAPEERPRRRRRGRRIDRQRGARALPRAAPGLRRVPGRGERLADRRALHPRERQGRDRHGWLRRDGPGTDAQRVRASRGDGQGALRVRLERREVPVAAAGGRCRVAVTGSGARPRLRASRRRRAAPAVRRHPQAARRSTTSAVDSWVEKHGTVVSSSAYGGSSGGGTLYYVSSSAATK